jgi:hypothetical protein
MTDEKSKYERVIEFLKNSKPDLGDEQAFSDKVIREIREQKSKIGLAELFYEFLFGWVYIGWVRKSMIAASLFLLIFFGYQQTVIMRRMENLSIQTFTDGKAVMTDFSKNLSDKVKLHKLFGGKINNNLTVTEKDIDQLIESINELQIKYKDVLNLLENNPQMKKYMEEKLKEKEAAKPKI